MNFLELLEHECGVWLLEHEGGGAIRGDEGGRVVRGHVGGLRRHVGVAVGVILDGLRLRYNLLKHQRIKPIQFLGWEYVEYFSNKEERGTLAFFWKT